MYQDQLKLYVSTIKEMPGLSVLAGNKTHSDHKNMGRALTSFSEISQHSGTDVGWQRTIAITGNSGFWL